MTWAQYWQFKMMDAEISALIIAALLVLGIIGLVGYLIYDKIQDLRGN